MYCICIFVTVLLLKNLVRHIIENCIGSNVVREHLIKTHYFLKKVGRSGPQMESRLI